jgi:hypothetical protein
MKALLITCATIIILCGGCQIARPPAFYVDALNGNDENNGLDGEHAWKTLDKVNTHTFKAGDQIFLKRGQEYKGALQLKGSGKPDNPIRISALGVGRRPVINAGEHESAIQLLDEQYWEISDIETTGGLHAGIFIGITKNHSELNNFRINNCYVHDVGTDSIYKWDFCTLTGGIVIANGYINNGNPDIFTNSSINDAVIDGCTARYIKQWTTISISSGSGPNGRGDSNFIRNCTTEFSVADGIRMNGVKNSIIEYSVMYKIGAWPGMHNVNWGGLGAWFFEADDCTIQYCEASYIENWHNDGGAFDIDYYQTNSTIQDCYGHDCHGYGVSVFGADSSRPTINSVVRNNVLRNNGRDPAYAYQGDFFIFTWNGGLLDGVQVYNNTSYWNPVVPAYALKQDADYTGSHPNTFTNNTIISEHSWLVYAKNDRMKLDSNHYWVNGNKQPVWMMDSVNYYSLSDWQKATHQDLHSIYRKPELDFIQGVSRKGKKEAQSNKEAFVKGLTKPILLSFIDLQNSDPEFSAASRAQLTFIKSMERQYADNGLQVIIVDGSKKQYVKEPDKNAFKNKILDWKLEGNKIIKSGHEQKKLMEHYKVKSLPTTFLVSADGTIQQRWDDIALPASTAFAIEALIDKSHLRNKSKSSSN